MGVREDLRQVVADVRELPETQRTALLLREIDGLSYDQIAGAMDTTVPGVKSLLVRARVALAETAEGRLLSCDVVHFELREAAAGRMRLSGAARRHAKSCELCAGYQSELGVGRRAAALLPLGPVALVRDLLAKLGLGAGAGASASAAGAGAAAVGGGAATGACGVCGTAVGTSIAAIGGKAAVMVATAGLVAAGAANIDTASHAKAKHVQPAIVQAAPAPPVDTDVPAAIPGATAADPVAPAPKADKQPSDKKVADGHGHPARHAQRRRRHLPGPAGHLAQPAERRQRRRGGPHGPGQPAAPWARARAGPGLQGPVADAAAAGAGVVAGFEHGHHECAAGDSGTPTRSVLILIRAHLPAPGHV